MINNNYQFITYWFTLHFFYFAFFFSFRLIFWSLFSQSVFFIIFLFPNKNNIVGKEILLPFRIYIMCYMFLKSYTSY